MGKRGPEPTRINWDEFDKLVSYQCTQIEIAHFFGICVETLENICLRDRGEKLSDIWAKRKSLGKVRLRKAQFDIVERMGPGAATMAIYLDKKIFPLERIDIPQPEIPPAHAPGAITPPGKKSFEDFCTTAGYPKPFARQIEMMTFGMGVDDPRLLMGARGYGKTDYVTVLGVGYDVYLHGVNTSNLIISKSKTRNTSMIEEIASALKANGVLLDKENSSCLRVAGLIGKDHSVEVLTIKSSFRGRHPKRILMDDPVTEEDTSEAMRILVKKKYDEAYKLCKNIVIIGQPAHAFDLYAELGPQLTKLMIPHGQIPELDADLEAMKLAGVDAHSIEMSYHLRIPKEGASIFANLNFIDQFPAGDSVAFIDPSDGGDYTAVSILKGHFSGVAVQGHAWKKAWYHCLDDMLPIFKARGVRKICFETNCTGSQPIEQLRKLLKDHAIGVVGVHSDTNKHAVILSAGSYSHLIHLSKTSDRIYTNQVTQYEYKSKHDDAPDSLARGLEWIGLIRGKK